MSTAQSTKARTTRTNKTATQNVTPTPSTNVATSQVVVTGPVTTPAGKTRGKAKTADATEVPAVTTPEATTTPVAASTSDNLHDLKVEEIETRLKDNSKEILSLTRTNTALNRELSRRLHVSERSLKKKDKTARTQRRNVQTGFRCPKPVPPPFVEFINSHGIKYVTTDTKLQLHDDKDEVVLDANGVPVPIVNVTADGYIQLDSSKLYPRTLITHILYMYIAQAGLKGENGRHINADADLKALLRMGKVAEDPTMKTKDGQVVPKADKDGNLLGPFKGEDEVLEFTNFQSFMSRVFNEFASQEEDSEETA